MRVSRVSHRCWKHGRGSSKFVRGGRAWVNTVREHGELKILFKNTCERVHLLVKLPAVSLKGDKFRSRVVDLKFIVSFIVTRTHQDIKALFCCLNFNYYDKFYKKMFFFYLFSFEYIKKRKMHIKLDCASNLL